MPIKTFTPAWVGVYNQNTNSYHGGGSPMSIGGVGSRFTYIGLPAEVREALKTSNTTPELRFKFYVTDNFPDWSVGRHKDTYNKAGGTMPWYNWAQDYDGVGLYWNSIQLTNNFMDDYEAGTYQGIVLYSRAPVQDYNYGEAFGLTSGSNSCYFEVTGDWNQPPNKTSITYPKGGEIVDDTLTVTWNAGTDPDGNTGLSYRLAVSVPTGWKYYTTTATSYKVDMSTFAEMSNARVAVEVLDSKGFSSGFVYSNYFTISHNSAPNAPTSPSPASGKIYDRTQVIRFSWKHNDDGSQAGFQHAWRTVASDGTRGAWNYYPSGGSTFQNTTDQFYNMPANTLSFGQIEWAVRTLDNGGLTSPWTYTIFTASNPTNAPTITTPSAGNWNSQQLQVSWSSINQIEYQVTIYDSLGATVWTKSGTGATKTVYPDTLLANGKTYGVWVKTKSSDNQIWSDWSSVTINTQFTPPTMPYLERIEDGNGTNVLFYKSSDVSILPDFQVGEGQTNPLIVSYSSGACTIDSKNAVTPITTATGNRSGIMMYLTANEIPIVIGAKYIVSATSVKAGNRVYVEALDSNGTMISYGATSSVIASSPVGAMTASLVLPANTVKIRVIYFMVTDAPAGSYPLTDCNLRIENLTAPTSSIDVLRREYTPSGEESFIQIATGLSTAGTYIDYTPASNTSYEYKIRAVSSTGTTAESIVEVGQTIFENTLLTDAGDFTNTIALPFCTSRDATLTIESKLQQFAGRQDPVREFGEQETIELELEWEVQSFAEVTQFKQLWRKRNTMLYRDANGRRYWVTADELQAEDKPVNGFVLKTKLTATAFDESV